MFQEKTAIAKKSKKNNIKKDDFNEAGQKKYVAYYRVSTEKQGVSGLGLSAQTNTVANYVSKQRGSIEKEFVEVESGRDNNRIELKNAIEYCLEENCVLVVAKLDRLSRNVYFISSLMEAGIDFVCCDMPNANRFTIHIFAALAQQERDMISERTKVAMAEKMKSMSQEELQHYKDCSSKGGKKVITKHKYKALLEAQKLVPVFEDLEQIGICKDYAIAMELNRLGMKTSRGTAFNSPLITRYKEYLLNSEQIIKEYNENYSE